MILESKDKATLLIWLTIRSYTSKFYHSWNLVWGYDHTNSNWDHLAIFPPFLVRKQKSSSKHSNLNRTQAKLVAPQFECIKRNLIRIRRTNIHVLVLFSWYLYIPSLKFIHYLWWSQCLSYLLDAIEDFLCRFAAEASTLPPMTVSQIVVMYLHFQKTELIKWSIQHYIEVDRAWITKSKTLHIRKC